MKIKDLFSKIGEGGNPNVEQNEREAKMNGLNINFTPEELDFTTLCVKTIGTILEENPEAFNGQGFIGLLFKHLSQLIDMKALFEKFQNAMLKDILDKHRNHKNRGL